MWTWWCWRRNQGRSLGFILSGTDCLQSLNLTVFSWWSTHTTHFNESIFWIVAVITTLYFISVSSKQDVLTSCAGVQTVLSSFCVDQKWILWGFSMQWVRSASTWCVCLCLESTCPVHAELQSVNQRIQNKLSLGFWARHIWLLGLSTCSPACAVCRDSRLQFDW